MRDRDEDITDLFFGIGFKIWEKDFTKKFVKLRNQNLQDFEGKYHYADRWCKYTGKPTVKELVWNNNQEPPLQYAMINNKIINYGNHWAGFGYEVCRELKDILNCKVRYFDEHFYFSIWDSIEQNIEVGENVRVSGLSITLKAINELLPQLDQLKQRLIDFGLTEVKDPEIFLIAN